MKINPIASTMFLLSAIATGRNTVTGFSTPLSRHVHKSSVLFMNAKGGGEAGGKLTKVNDQSFDNHNAHVSKFPKLATQIKKVKRNKEVKVEKKKRMHTHLPSFYLKHHSHKEQTHKNVNLKSKHSGMTLTYITNFPKKQLMPMQIDSSYMMVHHMPTVIYTLDMH